jgi:hypothetical protein
MLSQQQAAVIDNAPFNCRCWHWCCVDLGLGDRCPRRTTTTTTTKTRLPTNQQQAAMYVDTPFNCRCWRWCGVDLGLWDGRLASNNQHPGLRDGIHQHNHLLLQQVAARLLGFQLWCWHW